MQRKPTVSWIVISLMAVLVGIAGCDRETGTSDPVGSQGPEMGSGASNPGPIGDQGLKGETGEKGPEGEDGPAPNINVLAMLQGTNSVNMSARFTASVFDVSSIPEVALDDVSIPIESEWWLNGGRMTWRGTVAIDSGDTVHLDITYTMADGTAGLASSALPIPAYPTVVDNPVSCVFGNDIKLEWNRAQNASAYYIAQYSVYKYIDTAGTSRSVRQSFDTVIAASDTILLIPADNVFPDSAEVDSTKEFFGDYQIRALSGPWRAGNPNNITGDGYGMFVGTTYRQIAHYQLSGAPLPKASPLRQCLEPDNKMLFENRVLEYFSKQNR